MGKGRFATSVSCMDGRIQVPILNWIKARNHVDYVDVITEPGIDKRISDSPYTESTRAKVEISVRAHNSSLVVVSGHHDCAGNPVSEEEHISQIKEGVRVVSSWNLGIEVVGVWVDGSWNVTPV